MSSLHASTLPIKPYSIATFTAGTALLLTTLLMLALNPTPPILFFAAAMVGAWYAGLKSTERELKKERDIIAQVLSTAACCIVVLDKQGRIVRFNQACEKITGYSFAEVKNKCVWDLFLIPDEVEPVQTVFDRVLQKSDFCSYQNYWLTKDGRRRLISWSNTVILDRHGLVEYVVATGTDITDRQQAEIALAKAYSELETRVKQRTAELTVAKEALQAEEERFRSLSSCSPSGIFMADIDGRCTYANPRCLAITGFSLAELLGDGWQNGIHPEDKDRVLAKWDAYIQDISLYEIEYRWQTTEGIIRWVKVCCSPMFSDSGKLIGQVGTVQDITERLQAQEALASSERQLKAVLENTPDIIIRTDKQLRYIYVNEAVARTQGVPVSYFLGKTSKEIGMSDELCQLWDDTLRKVLATGREQIIEFESPSANGIRSYQSRVVPEFDKDGVPETALIVARDITELKLAEIQKAQLLVEQTAREKAEKEQARSAFLAEVSNMLATAFDGETVLQNVAQLAVSIVADGCCIHLIEPDGNVRKAAVANVESSKIDTLERLRMRDQIDPNFANGYPLVIRTGKSELIPEVDEAIVAAAAAEERAEIEMLRSLDIGSHACAPLIARGRVMGAISCFTSKGGRRYNAEDIAMLEDLAYRVAIALDNARLYAEAQQALAEKSQSFALIDSLLEASPLGICFFDRDLRFIRINRVLAELNGLGAQQHLGQDFRQLLPESSAQFAPVIQQVLDTGEPILNLEIRGEPPGKPGEFGYWLGNYYPVKNRSGEILGAGIILTDITAAKQTEIALQESEMRFRSVVESNTIGIGFWDINGQVTEANDVLLKMLGYSREELVLGNLRWPDLTPPEHQHLDRAAFEQVQAFGKCTPFEKEYIRKDGSRFPVLVGGSHFPGCKDKGSFFVLDITERKLAQNIIRENEARIARQLAELDLVYNTAPVGLCFVDTDLRYVRMNEYFAAIDGRPIADRIGRTVREAIPELADALEPIYRQVLATQTPVLDLEVKAATLQQPGVLRDWLVSFYPVGDESGTLLGISTVVQEITDRKQAQRAMRQSELIFRRLFESDIFGVAIGDFTGRMAYANDTLLKMVGYTRADVLSGAVRWDRMTPPEYLHLDAQAAQELRAKGIATPFKKEYIRKDGSRVPILMGGATLDGCDREPETIVAFYIDLTEIERVQAQLKYDRERLQIAQQAGRIGTFEWNIQTDECTWTPELEALYGLPAGSFGGSYDCWAEMLHPDDRAFAEQQMQAAAASGGEVDIEYRICRADGKVRWMACKAIVFKDDWGVPLRAIGVNADISERKQAEAERALLLEREQAARAQAEANNRLKDEFLTTLSHELRTPLNTILGWSQHLRKGRYTPAVLSRALEAIERQARVQTQLVEDLLDVSRIVQGKLVLKPGWFNMVKAIEGSLNSVSFAAEAKSVTVRSQLDRTVGSIWGDAVKFQQIVSNLLSNAVKFTPPGGTVELQVSALGGNGEPNYLQIRVSDTGKGISAEFLPYVFDRFRQADGSITRAEGGLGLGLAIVRHLVELHAGTVTAASPGEGQGATFTVSLPLKQPIPKAEGMRNSADRSTAKPLNSASGSLDPSGESKLEASGGGALAGLAVLVVDDEFDNREFLAVAVEECGARAIAAASAAEAIEILETARPDILVSDIGMPDEDGYSLIRKIRASESDKIQRLPAVALTAYAGGEYRTQAIAAGYDEHLTKPIEPAKFATVLAKLVGT